MSRGTDGGAGPHSGKFAHPGDGVGSTRAGTGANGRESGLFDGGAGLAGGGDYAVVFRSHSQRLVRLAGLLGSDDPEDIVAEVFAKVIATDDLGRANASYLRVAVVNAVRDRHRRVTVARNALPRLVSGASVPDTAVAVVVGDEIQAALVGLAHRYREVLVLRYWADLPVGEIAEVLGSPVGTVKSLLSRAHEALRSTIEKG